MENRNYVQFFFVICSSETWDWDCELWVNNFAGCLGREKLYDPGDEESCHSLVD